MSNPTGSPLTIDWISGALLGPAARRSEKKFVEIKSLFRDQEQAALIDPNTVVYRIEYWLPVTEGTFGGLFWGTTFVAPGKVGDEFFMTHGHFHAVLDRAEYYATLQGEGALILMDEAGKTWSEVMQPGSVHYIPGATAHRVANTGNQELVFVACWPSDAGHDYEKIRSDGFGARLRSVKGIPTLVPEVRTE
ncbi:MAG TPA: glucose-6-phosphate isomerase family protein [Bryobacteraceae bacterium]|jgi:glucose-6-phosphate isomerase|nr:glucose-6-phosphate isomerase family protein [Bryobacteraceae bacterium]